MDLFDVYVLRFEVNEDKATRALMQVFGLSEAAARIFVHSVPRIGKRDVPTPMAERYVRALHAVGAIVECRRIRAGARGELAAGISLPAPSLSNYPSAKTPPHIMQDSLGIMAPLAYAPDMPEIPKAPRLPADLHQIRARKGPDSLAPHWRANLIEDSLSPGRAASPQSSDPDLWSEPERSPLSSDPLAALEHELANRPEPTDPSSEPQLDEPPAAEPLQRPLSAPHAGSPKPSARSLSPTPFAASKPARSDSAPWYATATNQLLLAALIIAAMGVALSAGIFDTDVNGTAQALRQAGIDPGTYEPAERYLAEPTSHFQSMQAAQLQALVERLSEAGAREVWVADIHQRDGQRTSHTLVLDLPPDPNVRRALFDALASAQRPEKPKTPDIGQRFLKVDF